MTFKFLRGKGEAPSRNVAGLPTRALTIAALGSGLVLGGVAFASSTLQPLPFLQDWTNTGLITANDDWDSVPGIVGFNNVESTSTANGAVTGVDPQTVVNSVGGTSTSATVFVAGQDQVFANNTAPASATSGGTYEVEIANPTIALNGSGTADSPNIVLFLNATGQQNINVSYRLRDLDSSVDNAVQPVALQFRVGNTGDFINVPAGFVADASSGPSLATMETLVNTTLPAAANGANDLQVRIITTNAAGNDEIIGIDDISVTANGTATPTATPDPNATATPVPTATTAPTATPVPTPTATPVPGVTPAPSTLVISEIYGGGGNTGATFTNDFIELYNGGTSVVNLSGYSVQYASATGTSFAVTPLNGSIAPGGFYLVQEASNVATNPPGAPLPPANAFGTINLSGASGKIALVSSTTAITGISTTGVIDFVGFGGANQSETAPGPAGSNTASITRMGQYIDTNDNSKDFMVLATPSPSVARVAYAVAGSNLYSFDVSNSSAIALVGAIGFTPEGIDFNPANGLLYALDVGANTTTLYTLSLTTGAATAVGGFNSTGTGYNLVGQNIGFDFNPKTLQIDGSIRIRVTAQNGSDLRLNSATGGVAAVDPMLNGAATSSVGSAYANNLAQTAGTTALYNVSDTTDSLYLQNPPNNGTLVLQGATGIDIKPATGFDIFTDSSGTGNSAFLATNLDGAGGADLFTVNLSSGAATAAGNFGSIDVSDIALQTISPTITAGTAGVIINEFRVSGPGGTSDEFIELYNQNNVSVNVSGWTLTSNGATSSTNTVATIPNGRTIPAYGRLLLTGGGYSLANYGGTNRATGDLALSGDLTDAGTIVRLFNAAGAVVDMVNSAGMTAPTSLQSDYSFVRRMDGTGGAPQDTGTDSADFNTVDVASTVGPNNTTGVSSGLLRLGAPGPQNLASPIVANQFITFTPANPPSVRVGSGNGGTLALRYVIGNPAGSGRTITALRFRAVALTAGTTAVASDGTNSNGPADVRLISSSSSGTILPLILETPPTQPNGGGFNSSISLSGLPAGGIAAGSSVTVEFVFNVVQRGQYRFAFNVEPVATTP